MLKRKSQKFLKVTAFILGGVLLLMTAFHFWFINHAEELVEDMVSSQSNGKLRLKIDKFKFNWFSYKMELRKANFYSTDTAAATAYQFSVPRIKIRVKEILPLVLEKKILIDSLHLFSPDITVTRLRSLKDTTADSDTNLSLPQEMGRIYNSIQDALRVLKVGQFRIDKGRFSLVNKIRPDAVPVVITDINFLLDNLQVDTTQPGGKQKILFSDNVALHTSNQNILFPDGRHRLSFRDFRINIENRLVEFDSCTVVATKGDSAKSSFRIFFDKLRMTNIDFTTLYHNEIIKADSVYCVNPRFSLDVDLEERSGPAKSPPRLDELVRELTGNMQLAFVVVDNAAFNINTSRAGRVNSFTSDNNNFELQGLQINKYGKKPLTVEKFVMAIRNYENFLRDSSYAIQFDSIHIINNRISLNNFMYQELEGNKVVNNLSMPRFELQGLSWDDLVFNQQLSAQKVNLYRPVINYTVIQKRYNTKDVFQTLAGIGNFMQLENLNITDGQVNLYFKNNIQLTLENANITVLGKKLVDSRKISNIQKSVTQLHFKKGKFKMSGLTADLTDVSFSGIPANHLQAGTVHIQNKNEIDITVKNASIRSMIINDDLRQSVISGITWSQAAIRLFSLPKQNSSSTGVFLLKDIHGSNTSLLATDSNQKLSAFFQTIEAVELATTTGNKLHVEGLSATGGSLHLATRQDDLHINKFSVTDHRSSVFENIQYSKITSLDSVHVAIPKLEIQPDINGFIDGQVNAREIHISNPLVRVHLTANGEPVNTGIKWPLAKIGKLTIDQPQLEYSKATSSGTVKLSWKGQGNVFELTDLNMSNGLTKNLSAEMLRLSLHKFLFRTAKGKTIDAGEGRLELSLGKLKLRQDEAGAWDWNGVIRNLDATNFMVDSLGKNAGRLSIDKAKLNDLAVSSANLLNLREMVLSNTSFRLHEVTGSYHNAKSQFNWNGLSYDKNTRFFSADSFSYQPASDRESFINSRPYQTDYITGKTGAITIGPFDIDRYARDSVLDLGVVTINDGLFTDFRDKRKPREPGIIRSLPVNLLKKIPVRILADTLQLNNTHVEYEEVNEKTGTAGKINVTKLNGRFSPLRNYNLSPGDSLDIRATASLENKLFTRLHVKESYTDSLGGFVMTVTMDSAELSIFNPILKGLASAEIKTGYVDSMMMRVDGREALAIGEMKMVYHDLKINVIKDGKKRRLLSFLINGLVKNKNTNKKGTVFFERLRDRSAINYLVKITLSGISSSVGIKKTDRLARKNKQQFQPSSGK